MPLARIPPVHCYPLSTTSFHSLHNPLYRRASVSRCANLAPLPADSYVCCRIRVADQFSLPSIKNVHVSCPFVTCSPSTSIPISLSSLEMFPAASFPVRISHIKWLSVVIIIISHSRGMSLSPPLLHDLPRVRLFLLLYFQSLSRNPPHHAL